MAKLTNKDLWRIWQDLDLAAYDERDPMDRVDDYCAESYYTYHIPEGTLYVTALDVLPEDNFAEILCVEFSDGINEFDITRAIKTEEITGRLLSDGWKATNDRNGELVLVRFSDPRIGYKPATGTLIIGYHEHPQKVYTYTDIKKIIDK